LASAGEKLLSYRRQACAIMLLNISSKVTRTGCHQAAGPTIR
jgi:hypothetical protein